MSSSSSSSLLPASTSTHYSLEVEYIGDTSRKHNVIDRKSSLYVEVSLGDVLARSRSIRKDAIPVWNHTFTLLTSEQSCELTIEVTQLSALRRTTSSVGRSRFRLDELVKRCDSGIAELHLSLQLGTLRLRLRVINEITYTVIELRNLETRAGGSKFGQLPRLMGFTSPRSGFVATQLNENRDLYQNIGNLLQKLDIIAKTVGDFAAIEPHLAAAWAAISALYKWIFNQLKRDERVIDLVRRLLEKFQFVDGNASLRNKTVFLKSAIASLLITTIKCCTFIKGYFSRMFIRRMLSLRDSQRIGTFEKAIDDLTELFNDGDRRYKDAIRMQTDLKIHLRPSDMDGFGRPRCLENTQLETRRLINEWIDTELEHRVFWLYGVAGSGKSTIASTIAYELRQTHQLGAFLFFTKATSKPQDVIRTLVYQLAMSNPLIATHVTDGTLGNDLDSFSAEELLENLVLHPLIETAPENEGPVVIILDALDECGDPTAREELLRSFETAFSKLPANYRLLITSRPEPDLHGLLYSHPYVLSFKLDPEASKRDVAMYLSLTLEELFRRPGTQPVPKEWQWDANIAFLGKIACGLFIWASTVCKHIKQSKMKEFQTLEKLISEIQSHGHAEFGIDSLYTTLLDSTSIPWNDEDIGPQFPRILYLILGVEVAFSTEDIDSILGLSPSMSSNFVSRLQSVLTFTEGSRSRIQPLHASFADFLKSPEQSQKPWYIDMDSNREYIKQRCLNSFDTMDRALRLYSFDSAPFNTNYSTTVLHNHMDKKLPDDLSAACVSWGHQLIISPFSLELAGRLSHFLHCHLLPWIELISRIRKVESAILALERATMWISGHNDISLERLLKDALELVNEAQPCLDSFYTMERMLQFNICDIETSFKRNVDISGLQNRIGERISDDLKSACISWANQLCTRPALSLVVMNRLSKFVHNRLLSWLEVLSLIKKVMLALTSLESAIEWVAGNNASLESFLRDAYKLISAFEVPISESLPHIYASMILLGPHRSETASHYSRIISPMAKVKIAEDVPNVFNGHTNGITSVTYSPDGRYIASGSWDRTIKVWSAENGELVLGSFKGPTDSVLSIAYSPDGRYIVSGSYDNAIRVWIAKTGELVAGPFKGHSGDVNSVSYSPNGNYIASGSNDGTTKVWDVKSGEFSASNFGCHSRYILSVAYSPDGKHLVTGSSDRAISVRNAESGEFVVGPIKGHSGTIFSVTYSPDGKYIASGSMDRSIRVWSSETGELVVGPFEGHSNCVRSVSYSPDGKYIVSGSDDRTVIVWNAGNGKLVAGPFKGHLDHVCSVAYSSDGKHVVSGSEDHTIRVWSVINEASPLALSINTTWVLSKDGWICGEQGELMLWVPPDMRHGLCYPHNDLVLSCQSSTRIYFKDDRIGENWMRCIESHG